MATATACERVFKTVELLEQILLNLAVLPAQYPGSDPFNSVEVEFPNQSVLYSYYEGCRTLFFCQRVSKVFRNTITGSALLQQALFFRPPQTLGQQPIPYPSLLRTFVDYPQCSVQMEFDARETVNINVRGCTWERAAPILAKVHPTSSALRIHLGSTGCKVTSILVTDGRMNLNSLGGWCNPFTYDVHMIDATIGEVIGQAASMQVTASASPDITRLRPQ